MRMKKRVTIGLLLVTLVIALTGCGVSEKKEAAARELITQMMEAADGAVVSQSDCTAKLDTELTFGNREFNWWWEFETHNEYDKESGRANSEVVYYKDKTPIVTKFHMTEEQGVFYIYGKQEDTCWLKYDTCFLKDDMSRNFVSDMHLESAEIIDYKADAKEINGKKVHKLSVRLQDASIRELLFEAGFKLTFWGYEYNSIDLSDVTVQMDYYVDAETNQVVKLEAQLGGMKEFLCDLVACNNNLSYEDEYKDGKVENCVLVYDNINYEERKVPMLDFETKKESVLVHQVDTVYTVGVMDAEAEVTCPKGWAVISKDTNVIRIGRFDDQIDISFGVYMPKTIEDGESWIAGDIEYMKEEGLYVSDKKGPEMEEFETYEVLVHDGIVAYAYKPIKRALAYVCVNDYTSSRLDKTLPEVLEMVKFKESEW